MQRLLIERSSETYGGTTVDRSFRGVFTLPSHVVGGQPAQEGDIPSSIHRKPSLPAARDFERRGADFDPGVERGLPEVEEDVGGIVGRFGYRGSETIRSSRPV